MDDETSRALLKMVRDYKVEEKENKFIKGMEKSAKMTVENENLL